MDVTFLKAVLLLLCFFSLALAACSEEPPNKPERGDTRTAPQRTVASGGYVEHTVGSMTLRQDEGVLVIEEAKLFADEEGDNEIFVQAKIRGGQEGYRGCFLMEERAWVALRRSFESGSTPDPAVMPLESSWADPLLSDEFSGDDTYAVVFHEDPVEEAVDPERTPFFALCFKNAEGSGQLTAWYDVAHVEGTPEASR